VACSRYRLPQRAQKRGANIADNDITQKMGPNSHFASVTALTGERCAPDRQRDMVYLALFAPQ
jgi:hypothetical protein